MPTALFIHGGWLHLGLNLLFLLVVGRMVEWVAGPGRLVLIFLLMNLIVDLLYGALDPRIAHE